MIDDFDGPDPAPNRRGHMLVVSVLLVVGVVAGYAAVSSPELRGPFATPRPFVSMAPAAAFTPAPVVIEPASIDVPFAGCIAFGSESSATVLADGRSVIISPDGQSVIISPNGKSVIISPNGQSVIISRPTSLGSTSRCVVQWGQPPSPIPSGRVGR